MVSAIIALGLALCIPAVLRDGLREMALRNTPDEHMTRATGDTYLSSEQLSELPRSEPQQASHACAFTQPPYGMI